MGILLYICILFPLIIMVINIYVKVAKYGYSLMKEQEKRERESEAYIEKLKQEQDEEIELLTTFWDNPHNSRGYGGWLTAFTDDEIDRLERGVPYIEILRESHRRIERPMTEIYY